MPLNCTHKWLKKVNFMLCFTSIKKELGKKKKKRAQALGPQCPGSYPDLLLTSCVTLGKSFHISVLEFPSQENRAPLGSPHALLVGW